MSRSAISTGVPPQASDLSSEECRGELFQCSVSFPPNELLLRLKTLSLLCFKCYFFVLCTCTPCYFLNITHENYPTPTLFFLLSVNDSVTKTGTGLYNPSFRPFYLPFSSLTLHSLFFPFFSPLSFLAFCI